MKLKKADCVFWAGENGWSYQITALLLHEIEPTSFQGILFEWIKENNPSIVPRKLRPAMKTFHDIFGILDKDTDEAADVNKKFYHPYSMFREIYNRGVVAVNKNPDLFKLVNARHRREKGSDLIIESEESKKSEKPARVSEATIFNMLGALVKLYWETKYPNMQKINQSTIIATILDRFPKVYGLSKRNLETYLPKAIDAIANEMTETS